MRRQLLARSISRETPTTLLLAGFQGLRRHEDGPATLALACPARAVNDECRLGLFNNSEAMKYLPAEV